MNRGYVVGSPNIYQNYIATLCQLSFTLGKNNHEDQVDYSNRSYVSIRNYFDVPCYEINRDCVENQDIFYENGISIKTCKEIYSFPLYRTARKVKELKKEDEIIKVFDQIEFECFIKNSRRMAESVAAYQNFSSLKECTRCGKFCVMMDTIKLCAFCFPQIYFQEKKEEKKENEEIKERGYIYFITDNELIKIGSTNAYPTKRMSQLNSQYYKDLSLLGFIYVEDFRKKEQELHKTFSKERHKKEWFDLKLSDIEKLTGFVHA
jgi:hypothetical protein